MTGGEDDLQAVGWWTLVCVSGNLPEKNSVHHQVNKSVEGE